nr:MAG TPA: hypothetical protein [Caudoviricetes sp.]
MRFREVVEVKEIKEIKSKTPSGISLVDKLDAIEGIKATDGYTFEENKEYWRQLFQSGGLGNF